MRLPRLRDGAWFLVGTAIAFFAVQRAATAQQAVPFDGGIPVAPAGFEPLSIPAEPLEFDTAEVMRIRVVPVARQLVNPWSLAFLSLDSLGAGDVTMLVTEKEGRLRIIRNGVLDPKPIPGVPDGARARPVRADGGAAAPAVRDQSTRLLHVSEARERRSKRR